MPGNRTAGEAETDHPVLFQNIRRQRLHRQLIQQVNVRGKYTLITVERHEQVVMNRLIQRPAQVRNAVLQFTGVVCGQQDVPIGKPRFVVAQHGNGGADRLHRLHWRVLHLTGIRPGFFTLAGFIHDALKIKTDVVHLPLPAIAQTGPSVCGFRLSDRLFLLPDCRF